MTDLAPFFEDDVTLDAFANDHLRTIHTSRIDRWRTFSKVPIILCLKLETGDVFCAEFGHADVEIDDDEMIDFPVATVLGQSEQWNGVKALCRRYLDAFESRNAELTDVFTLTQSFLDAFERFDTVIDIRITDGDTQLLDFSVVLNNYDAPAHAPTFSISIDQALLDAVADGSMTPAAAAKAIKVGGSIKEAAEIGGLILKHSNV